MAHMSRELERQEVGAAARTRLEEAARRVLERYPEVLAAYLFGSVARGEPARDLDVALLLADGHGSGRLGRIAAELERDAAPAGLEVDLRPLRGSSPRFRANVLRDGRLLIDRDPRARAVFEARAMAEWLDFAPTWRRMRTRLRQRWLRG